MQMYCKAVGCAQTAPCSAHPEELETKVSKPISGLYEYSVVYTDRAVNLMSGGQKEEKQK